MKMTEQEVLKLMEETTSTPNMTLDGEGQYDSLDLVTILQAIEDKTQIKIENDKEARELQTAMTPRKVIELMKKRGLVE